MTARFGFSRDRRLPAARTQDLGSWGPSRANAYSYVHPCGLKCKRKRKGKGSKLAFLDSMVTTCISMYRLGLSAFLSSLVAGCGPLPDFGGAELVACDALPDTECVSYEERMCGWRRVDEVDVTDPADLAFVSRDGTQLIAPPGRCGVVTKDETGRLATAGTHPCDVEQAARCVVLMPGEGIESFQRVGVDNLGGGLLVADLDPVTGACPLACPAD